MQVVGQLDAAKMLALFGACHATRRMALSHAKRVSISLRLATRLHVLASLLGIPSQPCFPALRLCIEQVQHLALLPLVVQPNRVKVLELEVSRGA